MKESKRSKLTEKISISQTNPDTNSTPFRRHSNLTAVSNSVGSDFTKLELPKNGNGNGNNSLHVTVEDPEIREEFDNHIYIHPTAAVSPLAQLGLGSRVWQNAQVRERAVVGQQCLIGKGVYIDRDVMIGDRVRIYSNVTIPQGVMIESGVFVGAGVCFSNDRYPRAIGWGGQVKVVPDHELECTLVRYGASIGAGAVILPGIRIGSFAMIEAGAVVSQDVADHQLIRGNPGQPAGFVCRCGKPLTALGADAGWVCPVCNEIYHFA